MGTPLALEILTGPDIWRVMQNHEPLIDGVLWDGDVVMLLGSEKAGKSILGLQLAFCLTSCTPFLDKYPVPKPLSVMYIQTEGKESEFVDRMHRMSNTVEVEETRFSRVFKHSLALDDPAVVSALIEGIKQMETPPRVAIIDSLYTSMLGDLNENQDVRRFIERASVGPRLELFGREAATGWTVWGNQITRDLFAQGEVEVA